MSAIDSHVDIGIVVRDADACIPFYRDVLGLKLNWDFPLPGKSHMWEFSCGPCKVKLVTHEPTPADANPPGGSRGGTGLRYWTMTVEDIEAMVATCEAAGAPVTLPVIELAPGVRIAMVEDPEGNWVEFLENTPKG